MGTDIHLRVQRRTALHDDPRHDVWEDVPEDQLGDAWHNANERFYLLFALLAGVRAAGRVSEALFAGRGAPEDLEGTRWEDPWHAAECARDHHYAMEYGDRRASHPQWDDWHHNPDYHSHTWATLAELRAADWASVEYIDESVTRPAVFKAWRDEGRVPLHQEHVYEDGGQALSPERFARLEAPVGEEARAEATRLLLSERLLVRFSFTVRPLPTCGFVLWLSSPAAEVLAAEAGGPDNIRLLIAFDN